MLESPKMATAGNKYNELKQLLYVDSTNPVALYLQFDNQFANTLRNLSMYVNIMHNYGAKGKKILLLLDSKTIDQLQRHNTLWLKMAQEF